jgi:hypothetical protein
VFLPGIGSLFVVEPFLAHAILGAVPPHVAVLRETAIGIVGRGTVSRRTGWRTTAETAATEPAAAAAESAPAAAATAGSGFHCEHCENCGTHHNENRLAHVTLLTVLNKTHPV